MDKKNCGGYCFFLVMWLLFLSAFTAAASSRSIGRVQVSDSKGEQVTFYTKSYALLIGVSRYTNGWSSLPGVEDDIQAVGEVLQSQGFDVKFVRDPDDGQLREAFANFVNQYGLEPDNRLLFYFAGHGHTMKQSYGGEMGYIVPKNAPNPDNNRNGFLIKALDMQEMAVIAKRIQSKHALFLFDSCFSGSVFDLSRAAPKTITYKTSRPVRQFITSGDADEEVPDTSIFRRQFVAGIEGESDTNGDGYVTGDELGLFLQDKVTNYSHGAQHPKYGKIRDPRLDKGDFVFVVAGGKKEDQQSDPLQLDNMGGSRVSTDNSVNTYKERTTGMEFVWVPGGCFQMGSPDSEKGRDPDEKQHEVCVDGFYMSKYEVTNHQYRFYKKNHDSRHFQGLSLNNDNQPVVYVSWRDALSYTKWLSEQTVEKYVLPTESQWEYAARGGVTSARFWPNGSRNTCEFANVYDKTANKKFGFKWVHHDCTDGFDVTAPVGRFAANGFGLHDMLGNVREWCNDRYGEEYYLKTKKMNPEGPKSGVHRVNRGGSWDVLSKYVRFASRQRNIMNSSGYNLGFRLVVSQEKSSLPK